MADGNALLSITVKPHMFPTFSKSRQELETEFSDWVNVVVRTADRLENAIALADAVAYGQVREQLELSLNRCGIARCNLDRSGQ